MKRSVVSLLLQKWYHALKDIPDKCQIYPPSSTTGRLFRAWQGDKLLGAAAARVIVETTEIQDSGSATRLLAKALSNDFLAEHNAILLPKDICACPSVVSNTNTNNDNEIYSNKEWGATLEAAVQYVHESSQQSSSSSSSEEAILELAQWLVETASKDQRMFNSKGRLLELGGTIQSYRVGGMDHSPVYKVIAELDDISVVIQESGKKQAVEQKAADQVLLEAAEPGALTRRQPKVLVQDCRQTQQQEEDEGDDDDGNQWNQKTLNNFGLTLHSGENYREWWERGAFLSKHAFRRAVLSPNVFDSIIDAQCWSQPIPDSLLNQSSSSHASFFVLLYRQQPMGLLQYFVTQVHRGQSITKANTAAALEVNRVIARLEGVSSPMD